MAWITAPLNAGPIPGTTYDYTIPGLSANTIYEYRAYMIVGGVEYYGQTYEINTLPPTQVPPTVHTGTPTIISPYEVQVIGNQVASGGTKPMLARGIVWSTSPNPTLPTLQGVLEQPLNMIGYYNMTMSSEDFPSLEPNTTYYVRAVAESGNQNVGYFTAYGEECIVTTPPIAPVGVDVCLWRTFTMGQNSATGCICTNPLLTTGQYLTVQVGLEQNVTPPMSGFGTAILEIFCKPSSSPYYTLIHSLNTNETELHKMGYASIPMSPGDMICWQQSTNGGGGSSSTIFLSNFPFYSPDIYPHSDLTFYIDEVYT